MQQREGQGGGESIGLTWFSLGDILANKWGERKEVGQIEEQWVQLAFTASKSMLLEPEAGSSRRNGDIKS